MLRKLNQQLPKKLIYDPLKFFRTARKSTIDISINLHHNYPYIQIFFMRKTARLLIKPLCLMQPGYGFTARCRLAHFAYHRRDFQLFVG